MSKWPRLPRPSDCWFHARRERVPPSTDAAHRAKEQRGRGTVDCCLSSICDNGCAGFARADCATRLVLSVAGRALAGPIGDVPRADGGPVRSVAAGDPVAECDEPRSAAARARQAEAIGGVEGVVASLPPQAGVAGLTGQILDEPV